MLEFKQEFINVAYSEFGIKALDDVSFEQAFAILDKMQELRRQYHTSNEKQLSCSHPENRIWYNDKNQMQCNECGKEI